MRNHIALALLRLGSRLLSHPLSQAYAETTKMFWGLAKIYQDHGQAHGRIQFHLDLDEVFHVEVHWMGNKKEGEEE